MGASKSVQPAPLHNFARRSDWRILRMRGKLAAIGKVMATAMAIVC